MWMKRAVRRAMPAPLYAAMRRLRHGGTDRRPAAGALAPGSGRSAAAAASSAGAFAAARADAEATEGMLSEFSMAVMDSLLALQDDLAIAGHVVEFGVFKGRSAMLLAHRARPSERLILVDIERYLDQKRLADVFPGFEFVQCASEAFARTFPDYRALAGNCRFLHVDSSHGFRTTLAELAMAEELLAERGILVLDDFTNLNYSQMIAATYKHLYSGKSGLAMFLVTEEKGYLCRAADFEFYARYVLAEMLGDMAARGLAGVCLARTDTDPEYRAIHLRPHLPGESGPHYGESIYGALYREP